MQITKKIILAMLITLLVINIIYTPKIFAISNIISDANNFLDGANETEMPINQENLKITSSKVYNILLACGIAVAVVVGAVLGIIFIFSSVEGKAKIQEALLPYVVGCVVVFGAFTIWKIAIETGNDIENEMSAFSLSATELSELTSEIDNGTKDIKDLTDTELKKLWSNNRIDTNIADKVKGSKDDPRSQGKGTEGMTVDEAINTLGAAARKIYDECERRGLVEKTETGVKLK